MPYEKLATSDTPAFVIYLLDISASMSQPLGDKRRIDVVGSALGATIKKMIARSTRGAKLFDRYRIAIYAYSDSVFEMTDGVKLISDIAGFGIPELETMRSTNTDKAFLAAENLLKSELPHIQDCPAPVICHMTDGKYTGDDPEPIVRRIMDMSVPDGNVLVENIYISDHILSSNIKDPFSWPGIHPKTKIKSAYAKKLRDLSSPIPRSYRSMMLEYNYHLHENAVMMFPGVTPALVSMGFQMSAATPTKDL